MYGNNNQTDFELNLTGFKASDISQQMRLGFIRKVYGILSAQLALTILMTIVSMSTESFKKFQMENSGIFFFFMVLSIVLPCVIICFPDAMRQVPYNYIVLFSFTFAESYIVSFICIMTTPKIVFMAAFMTFALVIALTAYAMTTKTDFTVQGGMIFVLGCAFMMFVIFGMFTSNKIFHVVLCVLGIALFGLYLLYDTQLIIGNKTNVLEVDDYILGSFMLYTDIIYIFLRILELIQLLNSE